ncbi:MAG: alanine--tRNA ligase [Zymomonas mobilis subsp. pomaceae]|uniref:Alanine--tRNA ligase n=1 Tax=Zymomonas mobilis subsp. pomaceae (strain ATCC 29192 / DSM 22645 / JCM 10191 / CCUG 17912 / NBRC 13757 / NCIMB 11200 / NRRL B-4491 / Barker I) TaxID=579138 RepID=F8EVB6_ZYMMT|nr:alanine--tRNA ligase [Zymomonas mobilis]AEI37323.1 alanyl-tRNA synthetase [Zymomonas mobilis subsp. pomaceae ATCC 29192]MDX5948691.1 alanine--tRNA ligase [Zymomonas mobilis subsp. pomaceae]GEB88496.1 alanine--tRNA ligase [Zymomonas mobilis subsp. pomaceae]
MITTNEIRRSFLEYFAKNGHRIVPSAPLVPQNDPTLMFVNAGMVPFKNTFTGLESRPYKTATSSQKCVRAGGKHNDLDNVGYTARHHTFFEMLGNFSFGDYFKERVIELAWGLITKEWGLDPNRLCVTVYHTDEEAFQLWRKIAGLPEDRIIRIATSDNFWSMGDTGPCGPCSEIFYDHGPEIPGGPPGSPDEDGDRFVEIWNLVFMQYEQVDAETRLDLPRPSIDTGMGLERIASVLQGVHDNYDTDTFKALIAASGELSGTATDGQFKASHRVIADHLRASGFLVADGVLPANEGRGYVLRRIMRRAMRHAHLVGAKEPLMYRLVPALLSEMGVAYPELVRAKALIEETLKLEETRFRQTLANGLKILEEETAHLKTGDTLAGEVAFRLYDTYGFPYDLTADALRARDLTVDQAGFDKAMAEQRRAARAAWKGSGEKASDEIWFDIADQSGSTEFTGYTSEKGSGQVVALIKDGKRVEVASQGDEVTIITNQTPFYGESGGQKGDTGVITDSKDLKVLITDTQKPLGRLHAHMGKIEKGQIKIGDDLQMAVDIEHRNRLRANHSATHLLHAALRDTLGQHVSQKGSMVSADRLRFDFSHQKALSDQEIATIEAEVNRQILGNAPVSTRLMTPEAAVEAGAMALFGEKYGDEVRVLSMGKTITQDSDEIAWSVELCGGTHVSDLGKIGLFHIISETAVSSGIRRIEAVTGEAARVWLVDRDRLLREAASILRVVPEDVPLRTAALIEERRKSERALSDAKKALALASANGGQVGQEAKPEKVGSYQFIGQVMEGLDPKALRGLIDENKKVLGSGIVALITINEGRASVAIGITDDLKDKLSAVDLVRKAVELLGGKGGGGRPDMAQGGGPDGNEAPKALEAIRQLLENA